MAREYNHTCHVVLCFNNSLIKFGQEINLNLKMREHLYATLKIRQGFEESLPNLRIAFHMMQQGHNTVWVLPCYQG